MKKEESDVLDKVIKIMMQSERTNAKHYLNKTADSLQCMDRT